MRVVGGQWRGRALRAPKGNDTRPTSDRVREGMFDALCSRLGSDLGGAVVFDPFAGTGALGLEALSRGASRAVFMDTSRDAIAVLEDNITSLEAGARTVVVTGDATGPALARAAAGGPFTLLLLDPPYRIEPALVAGLLHQLEAWGALAEGATIVYEHAAGADPAPISGYATVRSYRYGDTAVALLERDDDMGDRVRID